MTQPIYQLYKTPKFEKMLMDVISFHTAPNSIILDPTYGYGHSWKLYQYMKKGIFPYPYTIRTHDCLDGMCIRHLCDIYDNEFDGVFFDPPYIWGVDDIEDKRNDDYGRYDISMEDVLEVLAEANKHFPQLLKNKGKLFFKYTDVYVKSENKFYLTTPMWMKSLSNFHPIDLYICRHPMGNGTAFQVKGRICGVNNYTYLLVMEIVL